LADGRRHQRRIPVAGCINFHAQSVPPPRVVPIMTVNMDEGTGFGPVLTASSRDAFFAAVTATYQQVQASNPSERAAGVAREIAIAQPTLVGLQEATVWRTGPLGGPATAVQIDQLQLLQDALNARGLHYAPAQVVDPLTRTVITAIETDLDVEAPSTLGIDVRVTDRNVVLARTDLPATQFQVMGVLTGNFANQLVVPTVLGVSIPVPRGWISVDAKIRGTTYRFITTHLEASAPPIQIEQGRELLQEPANTILPVVIAGDLNSAASGGPDPNTTYDHLIAAGFTDAWALKRLPDQGFTWPLHVEDPYTFVLPPPLSERIDLVLVRNNIRVLGVERVGFTAVALSPSGLWPSDHAAVTAQLQMPDDPSSATH
jgi:endonuclease/exonuclease/phosphatase family metal-dependent hydrolase